jgi:hypothetical protein
MVGNRDDLAREVSGWTLPCRNVESLISAPKKAKQLSLFGSLPKAP